MNWLELALPISGITGLVLGCILGAWMGGVTLWKGPAIAIGGSVAQAALSELVVRPLTGVNSFLLDYAIFFVVAGVIAYLLHVGAKATALIIIGAFLGMMTFTFVASLLVFGVGFGGQV